MEKDKYISQLEDIRQMMDKSSRYLSLSGFSGIMAGLYAISGAFLANYIIESHKIIYISFNDSGFVLLISVALGVMLLSLLTAVLMSTQKSSKNGEKVWNSTAKRVVINFSIPMIAGGIFTASLISHGYFGLLAPATLIFYGLALLHCSKYTFENVRYLGISFVVLGLVNAQFTGKGLLFWTIGFGAFHIIYGILMFFIVERKQA